MVDGGAVRIRSCNAAAIIGGFYFMGELMSSPRRLKTRNIWTLINFQEMCLAVNICQVWNYEFPRSVLLGPNVSTRSSKFDGRIVAEARLQSGARTVARFQR